MSQKDRERLDFVAAQAVAQLPQLSNFERIYLLEGLCLILPADEREQCERELAALRAAESAQLVLLEMISEKQEVRAAHQAKDPLKFRELLKS